MAATASRALFAPEPEPLRDHGGLDTRQVNQPAIPPAKPEPSGSLTNPKTWWSLIRETASAHAASALVRGQNCDHEGGWDRYEQS
jgi:hypothetical protein